MAQQSTERQRPVGKDRTREQREAQMAEDDRQAAAFSRRHGK